MKEDLAEGHKLQGDRYEIVRLLGKSEYSKVYIAKDLKMLKSRIIKEVIFPENPGDRKKCIDYFQNEAKQVMLLKHSTLPRYFDYFEENESNFLVREFVEGKTLDQLLAKTPGAIPEKQFYAWASQICDIFIYLHNQSPPLFFGGLRPENLLITPMGKIRVMDFGNDRFFTPDLRKPILKKFAPEYLAPEVLEGEEISLKSDVYNLGALIYTILTGLRPGTPPLPFQTKSQEKPEYFRNFEDPVRKALSQTKDARYHSAAEFKRQLLGEEASLGGPQLDIDTPELNYIDIPEGRMVQGSFNIKNAGGGVLAGRITADVTWVRVFPEYFNQNSQSVEFTVHTNDLPEGTTHTAVITITTPTEIKKVPIEIGLHEKTVKSTLNLGALLASIFLPLINGIIMLIYHNHVILKTQQQILKLLSVSSPSSIDQAALQALTIPSWITDEIHFFNSLFICFALLCPVYLNLLYQTLDQENQKKLSTPILFLMLVPSLFAYMGATLSPFLPDKAFLLHSGLKDLSLSVLLNYFLIINGYAFVYYMFHLIPSMREFVKRVSILNLFLLLILITGFALVILMSWGKMVSPLFRIISILVFILTAMLCSRSQNDLRREE
ncbi:MAG: serine/threonine-protein kinase [Candidatus Eremiobacteraeota bacterium]|nr:serine/threonine-protein kinase [Candidatus Eremiobacteraeota bacterium]